MAQTRHNGDGLSTKERRASMKDRTGGQLAYRGVG
jgi:hypothetical protein